MKGEFRVKGDSKVFSKGGGRDLKSGEEQRVRWNFGTLTWGTYDKKFGFRGIEVELVGGKPVVD